MLLVLLYFPFLSLSLSSEKCPSYSCSTSTSTTDSACITYSNYVYTLFQCSNITDYCVTSGPGQEGFCQESYEAVYHYYPGQECASDSECQSNVCQNEICQGNATGELCTGNKACAVGLSCKGGVCSNLISIGEFGCFNDYDCVNNAGCNMITAEGGGECVEYYSIDSYENVDNCYGNYNRLCKSTTCSEYQGNNICLDLMQNNGNSPYACNTTDYCYSQPDSYTGTVLYGKCECALNGNSYCSLFAGDPEAYEYKNYRNAWVNSKEIHLCHTTQRFEESCIEQNWDSKKYSYFYYADYVNFYQKIYDAEQCVLEIYFPVTYYHLVNFEESSGSIIVAVIAFLVT